MNPPPVHTPSLLALTGALLISACNDVPDVPTQPTRAPLVDPETGRVEEIPATTRPASPLAAPSQEGASLTAAQRYSARLARVGMRTTRRGSRDVVEPALGHLGAQELRAHFADARAIAGAPSRLVQRDLTTSRDAAQASANGKGPTTSQENALLALEQAAITGLTVDWDLLRGSPRRIAGALDAFRGIDAATAAANWARSQWPTLSPALSADAADDIDLVAVNELPDDTLWVTFRRVRGGVPMPENLLQFVVTDAPHPLGAGVILRVEAQWDSDIASGSAPVDGLGEAQALLLAGDALGFDLERTDADMDLAWRCFREADSGPDCRPTWRVQARGGAPSAHDTVFLDARSGGVVQRTSAAAHYNGHIRQTTNYPFDGGDVLRDMRFAELREWTGSSYVYSSTDTDGYYSWSPPGDDWAQVGLHSRGRSLMELRHTTGHCTPSNYDWRDVWLPGGAAITVSPDPVHNTRGDWLMFHYLQYATDIFAGALANAVETPAILYFNAGTGGGGQFVPCSGSSQIGNIAVGAGNDTGGIGLRDVFWEELYHAIDWCIQTVGPGCGSTNNNPRTALGSSWGHASGGAMGSYLNDYETWTRGPNASNHMRYAGPNVVGDILLYDAEIEGTPTSGPRGCDPDNGNYNCAADEACFVGAMDRPRCMKRAASHAACLALFPDQPALLIDWRDYGTDAAGNPDVDICVSNDYSNGRIWMHLGEHLLNSAGYFAGMGAFHWSSRALTRDRQFTQTADNYHEAMAQWAGAYEASNAFHNVSTESFPWLDDTTDVWSRAEVIRTPRDGTLTFTQGGPTNAPLAFDQGLASPGTTFDTDAFLMFVDPNASYELVLSTASSTVDLCVSAYEHISGTLLGSAGCIDGAATPAARNATLTIPVGDLHRVDIAVSKMLHRPGSYQMQVRNTTDDYRDLIRNNQTSEPLANGIALSGAIDDVTDTDLFHYYAPIGTSGALTFTGTGAAANAILLIYQLGAPVDDPSGASVGSGIGSASTSVTGGFHYYVHINPLSTGAYTIRADHSGCGTCNGNGTYDEPLPLPDPMGGMVVNRLDQSAVEAGYDTWASCRDGVSCDWYGIDLAENERVTVTTYDIFDTLCDVEIGVYAPYELQYWRSSGIHAPMTWDLFGSMEPQGSQLTFAAPRAGTYRIRARAVHPAGFDCPRYRMSVVKGVVEHVAPPPIH